jgi:hypothetical protein
MKFLKTCLFALIGAIPFITMALVEPAAAQPAFFLQYSQDPSAGKQLHARRAAYHSGSWIDGY